MITFKEFISLDEVDMSRRHFLTRVGAAAAASAVPAAASAKDKKPDDGEARPGESVKSAMARMNTHKTPEEKANFLHKYMKSALDKGGFTNGKFAQHTASMKSEEAGCDLDEDEGIIEEDFIISGKELYEDWGELEEEAEHHGRKVKLGKPFLTPGGPKKRAVYVKNENGNVIKVNFGDPNMRIKKSIPARRRSYRARHHCETPGPRTKANYWSCKAW